MRFWRFLRRSFRWRFYRYESKGRGGAMGFRCGLEAFGRLWGWDRSLVLVDGKPYLDRWILYVAGYTLRLHKFYRGDDDRASHTHPWWFITFPLSAYGEYIYRRGVLQRHRVVTAWRFHFRPADFEHYVSAKWIAEFPKVLPFYTIVITGAKRRGDWGFYPKDRPGVFVPHREWT